MEGPAEGSLWDTVGCLAGRGHVVKPDRHRLRGDDRPNGQSRQTKASLTRPAVFRSRERATRTSTGLAWQHEALPAVLTPDDNAAGKPPA